MAESRHHRWSQRFSWLVQSHLQPSISALAGEVRILNGEGSAARARLDSLGEKENTMAITHRVLDGPSKSTRTAAFPAALLISLGVTLAPQAQADAVVSVCDEAHFLAAVNSPLCAGLRVKRWTHGDV
jgi:hypothetical protein